METVARVVETVSVVETVAMVRAVVKGVWLERWQQVEAGGERGRRGRERIHVGSREGALTTKRACGTQQLRDAAHRQQRAPARLSRATNAAQIVKTHDHGARGV